MAGRRAANGIVQVLEELDILGLVSEPDAGFTCRRKVFSEANTAAGSRVSAGILDGAAEGSIDESQERGRLNTSSTGACTDNPTCAH